LAAIVTRAAQSPCPNGRTALDIKGKTAIVTGAAAGIGQAGAIALARRGAARVVIVDIDEAGMARTVELVREQGAAAETHKLDLSDIPALEAWLADLEDVGGYEILYNNAGVVSGAPAFPEAEVSRLRFIIDVNLTAPVVATQIAARAMGRRGGGVIVNTISTVALGRTFSDVLYAATKGGLMFFTRSCAPLEERLNVRVMGLLPGLTNTPILRKTGADGDYAPWMAPILTGNAMCMPEDIADGLIDLIEDDTLVGGDWLAVRRIDGAVVRQWGHDETPPGQGEPILSKFKI
jgi:NAD(P)-dependent dehydrogenase (short-subunit alcohol dehydrogenase family)